MVYAKYYQLIKIKDQLYGLFWQGEGNNCNTYLFTDVLKGERPHVIIDPGHIKNEFREPCFEQLTATMQDNNLDPEGIGLVINTHAHPDHCAASALLGQKAKETKPLPIAFSAEEYNFWRSVDKKFSGAMGLALEKIAPFFLLGEGLLKLGAITLQVFLTPGHSPGSLCFYWPQEKVLFSGDVLFYGSVGRTDLPGGNLNDLRESINKLAGLDVEYLLPGHSTEYNGFIRGQEAIARNFRAVKMFFV